MVKLNISNIPFIIIQNNGINNFFKAFTKNFIVTIIQKEKKQEYKSQF